jgi:hypothetical protein
MCVSGTPRQRMLCVLPLLIIASDPPSSQHNLPNLGLPAAPLWPLRQYHPTSEKSCQPNGVSLGFPAAHEGCTYPPSWPPYTCRMEQSRRPTVPCSHACTPKHMQWAPPGPPHRYPLASCQPILRHLVSGSAPQYHCGPSRPVPCPASALHPGPPWSALPPIQMANHVRTKAHAAPPCCGHAVVATHTCSAPTPCQATILASHVDSPMPGMPPLLPPTCQCCNNPRLRMVSSIKAALSQLSRSIDILTGNDPPRESNGATPNAHPHLTRLPMQARPQCERASAARGHAPHPCNRSSPPIAGSAAPCPRRHALPHPAAGHPAGSSAPTSAHT